MRTRIVDFVHMQHQAENKRNEAIKINASPYGNLFLLLALTLVYLVISPFISALLVRIAIGR